MLRKKQSRDITLVGQGAVFEGTLKVQNSLHVDGRVEGRVEAEGLVEVGPDGVIQGDLEARDVAIAGTVEGRVTARNHLHVLTTGAVDGDVVYQTMEVERGGTIHGTSKRLETQGAAAAAGSGPQVPEPAPKTPARAPAVGGT
jgi:cytoskeletal protein CcmA (bactofilin family)